MVLYIYQLEELNQQERYYGNDYNKGKNALLKHEEQQAIQWYLNQHNK